MCILFLLSDLKMLLTVRVVMILSVICYHHCVCVFVTIITIKRLRDLWIKEFKELHGCEGLQKILHKYAPLRSLYVVVQHICDSLNLSRTLRDDWKTQVTHLVAAVCTSPLRKDIGGKCSCVCVRVRMFEAMYCNND